MVERIGSLWEGIVVPDVFIGLEGISPEQSLTIGGRHFWIYNLEM